MCRLMGYVCDRDTTLAEITGPRFEDFAALSSKHCDGWGVVGVESGLDSARVVIEPSQASKSEIFKEVTHGSKSNGALLHLRWATSGLAVKDGNTHPFTHGDLSFIHNGGITPTTAMDSFIDPDLFSQMRGETDSERYFATIITEVRKLGLVDGIIAAVRLIREQCSFSSLNAMILTPYQMIVVNEHNLNRVPAGEPSDYYDLYFRKDSQGVLVASNGWDQSGWQLIENHRALVIDRTTFEIEEFRL